MLEGFLIEQRTVSKHKWLGWDGIPLNVVNLHVTANGCMSGSCRIIIDVGFDICPRDSIIFTAYVDAIYVHSLHDV